MNLAGHVLVLTQDMKASGSNPEGKWLSRDGTVLTEWFEIPSMPIDGARFLVDGSMVTSHWGWLNGQFADLQTTVSPLPEWLAERFAAARVTEAGDPTRSAGLLSKSSPLPGSRVAASRCQA